MKHRFTFWKSQKNRQGFSGASSRKPGPFFPKLKFCGLAFLFLCFTLPAQENPRSPILISYERNFMRASLSAKAEILRDAATDEEAREFIGQLYELALDFSLANANILGQDPDMINLAVIAARGCGQSGNTRALEILWQVFGVYDNSLTRSEILGVLGTLGKGSALTVERLNDFLAGENALYRSRSAVDYSVVEACAAALGSLGDPSSYPVLFTALVSGYPDTISRTAEKSLGELEGDYRQFLVERIRRNSPAEKLIAFHAGINSDRLGAAEKGEIAEAALDVSLSLAADSADQYALSSLRFAAVNALGALQWNRANALVIRHFYLVQTAYQQGELPRDRVMEAVACLSAMGSLEAAQTLALQLGYLNARMERSGEYDDEIVLGLIKALGEIGNKAAFDNLLYVSYLPYPDQIQAAAREALNRLQW